MENENNRLREDLRALMWSKAIGLPEYFTDVVVQRRVGQALARLPNHPVSLARAKAGL